MNLSATYLLASVLVLSASAATGSEQVSAGNAVHGTLLQHSDCVTTPCPEF
jgi:hypothetical protein